MSDCAAAIRNVYTMCKALEEIKLEISQLYKVGVKDNSEVYKYYKLKDILYTQSAVLTAMINYSQSVDTYQIYADLYRSRAGFL